MATIRVEFKGEKDLRRWIRNAGMPPAVVGKGIKKIALAVQKDAAKKQILRGGRGKNAKAPHASRLTGRNGGAGIIGSIRVNLTGLPNYAEVGSDKAYASVHEFGGRVAFSASRVRSHTRSVAFGRKVAPFTVPSFKRGAYSANYPKRAFLAPALAKIAPQMPEIMLREWDERPGK